MGRFSISHAPAIFALAVLGGCNQQTNLSDVEQRISRLESSLSELQKEHANLKRSVELSELFRSWEGVAYLTPGSTGYAIVQMDLTKLTVGLSNIQPYANGSKVTLQFGNLSSATIDGLKATIEWGPVDKDGTAINKEAKSRDVSFNEALYPGTWNNSEVILEGVPPTALGFVRVKEVSHRAIRMRGR